MAQTDSRYFATYCRLDDENGDIKCKVNAGEVAVGLELVFDHETYLNERNKETARCTAKNLLDKELGFLPASYARRLSDLADDGWIVRLASSALIFNEENKSFYIEAAVIAYEPEYAEAFDAFFKGCLDRLGAGDRPDIRLSDKLIDAALEDPNFYKTVRNTTYPKLKKGEAYYKRNRSLSENMIIKGSERNIGCWIGTAFFWIVVIAAIFAFVYFFILK